VEDGHYVFLGQILALDSNHKDFNRWFKVVIVNCQILTTQGCLSWLFWGDVEAAIVSIG